MTHKRLSLQRCQWSSIGNANRIIFGLPLAVLDRWLRAVRKGQLSSHRCNSKGKCLRFGGGTTKSDAYGAGRRLITTSSVSGRRFLPRIVAATAKRMRCRPDA